MGYKKITSLFGNLALASVLLFGCSAQKTTDIAVDASASSDEPVEITAWAWDPNFNIKALEVARDFYEKENPDKIKLEIVENAQDNIVQKLNTSLSSGVTNGLPNIVLIEDYRAQSFLIAFPDSFFPLTDFINASDFAQYKIAASSLDGVNYAVPFDSGVTGLYVRKDLLETAGFTVEDVTDVTWQELAEIAKVMLEKTNTKLFSSDTRFGPMLRGQMQSSGAWYTLADGETPNIKDNVSLKETFETIKVLSDAGLVNIHNNWGEMLKAFNTGVVWAVPSGNWITPSITAEESQAGNWSVVPWPRQSVEGSKNTSNLGGASIYVLNIDGKEAAAEFVAKTFGSNTAFYKELLGEIKALGTYLPVAKTDAYDVPVAYFNNEKIYQKFAEWSAEVPAVNYGKNTYAFEDIISSALQEYLSGKTLDEVFESAQTQAETQVR